MSIYLYIYCLRNHFRGLSCFILGVHSVSSLLKPMEVNPFYYKTDIQLPPQLTLLGWELQRFYGPWRLWHSVVTIPQVQLTGSRSSWDSELYERTRLPFPKLLRSGIHRHNGAWQSPPCSAACGGKVLVLWVLLFPWIVAALPRVKGLNRPMLSLIWISHLSLHTLPWLQHVCFFVSIPTLVLSALVTDQLLLLQTSWCSLCVWSSRNCSPMCLSIF